MPDDIKPVTPAPVHVTEVKEPVLSTETLSTAEAAPAAVAAEIKKLNKLMLKIDGEEFEEQLPFDLEDKPEVVEYLKKHLQLSKVSQKRMAQSSTLEKEIGSFLAALKENPEEVLSDPNLAVDLDDLAKRIIERKIEQAKKTPEQLDQEQRQARLEQLENQLKERDEVIRQKDFDRIQEKMFVEYNTSIESTLKTAQLPVNAYMKGKIADYMLLGVKHGVDVKPEDVLPLVRKDVEAELKQMFEIMPSEVIEQLLGKETLKKFSKTQSKPIVTPASATKMTDTGGTKQDPEKKNEKMSMKEFSVFKGMKMPF